MSMYAWMLLAHSWWRWVVVLTGVFVLVWLLLAFGKGQTRGQRMLRFFPIALDVQVMLGVLLFTLSPLTSQAMRSGTLFADDLARYWSVEHAVPMLLALVLAHVGQTRLRKALLQDSQPSRVGRWLLVGAVLLLLAAIPWPVLPNGRPLFRL